MDQNTQTTEEQQPKKPSVGKVLYLISVLLLTAVMLFALLMYLWPREAPQPEPTVSYPTLGNTPPVTDPPETAPTYPPVLEGETDIRLNPLTGPVSLLGKAAGDYLAAENVSDVSEFVSRYWEVETRSDRGRPVELGYTVYSLPQDVEVESAVFHLYEPNGSGNYREYLPAEGFRSVYIYNLRTGTDYDYCCVIALSDGQTLTLKGSFQTAAGPRLLNISGLVNVRDLGGWVTADGKTVKQGLLYRGSEMDGAVEADFKLTAEGLEQLQALGIKTDFDLRHNGADAIPGAEHLYYDAIQYEHAFTQEGLEAVGKLFADLAEPENYPAYLHCTYGADRTGTMCYLLLGLLGVSDADLKRDYELTAMYYGYVSPAQMDAFVAKIAALPGENTQARVEYFLRSAGVTDQQMESIRQIFLG